MSLGLLHVDSSDFQPQHWMLPTNPWPPRALHDSAPQWQKHPKPLPFCPLGNLQVLHPYPLVHSSWPKTCHDSADGCIFNLVSIELYTRRKTKQKYIYRNMSPVPLLVFNGRSSNLFQEGKTAVWGSSRGNSIHKKTGLPSNVQFHCNARQRIDMW